MNDTTTDKKTVTVNGIELSEGDSLWRYAALRTWKQKLGDQKADEVLSETATALAENYPEAVNNAPVGIVKENLRGTPGIYDDAELVNYHAMEVMNVGQVGGRREVSIKDLKEQKTYIFTSHLPDNHEDMYQTWEPLSVLEDHLGVTILPVTDDE